VHVLLAGGVLGQGVGGEGPRRQVRGRVGGVLPMTMALAAARELGASQSEITAYATSGEINGELRRVVGYAGLIIS
jgi:hypothetical protein